MRPKHDSATTTVSHPSPLLRCLGMQLSSSRRNLRALPFVLSEVAMSQRSARHFHRTLVSVAVAALLIGSGIASARDKPASKDSVLATDAHGYLEQQQLPDSVQLVPPPPQEGSAALANDEAVAKAMLALRGTPRWSWPRRTRS